jgi:hypothetical protein
MKWKILNGFFAVMFVIFAAVQINDPDPGLWILVYGTMAVGCVAAIFDKYSIGIMVPLAGGYLILSALHIDGMFQWLGSPNRNMLFDNIAKMQYPYIEEAREFLGLLICLSVLLYLFYRQRALAKSRTKSETVPQN